LLSIFYAFDGWHTAAYFTEENKDPVKSMPKSMFIGVIVVALIYLLINISILYALPLAELSQSKLAAADAMQAIFGPGVGKSITIFLMLSIIGIIFFPSDPRECPWKSNGRHTSNSAYCLFIFVGRKSN
jgi:APA family basic amino acid/polyamine antiporter